MSSSGRFVNAGIKFSIHHGVMWVRQHSKPREPIRSRSGQSINCDDWQSSCHIFLVASFFSAIVKGHSLLVRIRKNSVFQIWSGTNVRQHSEICLLSDDKPTSNLVFTDQSILVFYGKNVELQLNVELGNGLLRLLHPPNQAQFSKNA